MDKKVGLSLKFFVALSFVVMIGANAAANILPLNGITTGAVSDSYPNLFAPTGLTFAIWGVIYLLLALHTLFYLGFFQERTPAGVTLLSKIGVLFSVSSFANTAWIFAWHYGQQALSVLLMIIILVCLIRINQLTHKERLSLRDQALIKFPFSVYFGWITVATIANVTTLLVSLGWDGFGISEPIWTAVIIVVGLLIGGANMILKRDIAYGLVLVWAYLGIYLKHTAVTGFASAYPLVIYTVIVCIVVLFVIEAYIVYGCVSRREKTA